ncbi:MAG: amidase domain-containing protein [Eubacteriales bacterium]|nr:amidase domain-containing protein [Eubacteriales bacterium]
MKKRIINKMFILILSVICLGMISSEAFAEEINSGFKETDKGNIGYQDPISVKIVPQELNLIDEAEIMDLNDFTQSIYDINIDEVDQIFSSKLAENFNDNAERTVMIYDNDFELLTRFSEILGNVYFTKQFPDFSEIYNLEYDACRENMLLIESWGYLRGINEINNVLSRNCEIKIRSVESNGNGVREILFQLVETLDVDTEDIDSRQSGTLFLASIVDTVEGPKLVNVWLDAPSLGMMCAKIQNMPQLQNSKNADNIMQTAILSEYEKHNDGNLYATPWIDSTKENTEEVFAVEPKVRTTIAYDRDTVAELAVMYAVNYNPRFYIAYDDGREKDCTNFVSQSIWQSPGWPFDDIGNSDAVKWYCTKQSTGANAGKYVAATASWSGVAALYEYFKSNDNLSLAGTVYGISANTQSYTIADIQVGDVVQFAEGSNWHHSVIVSAIGSGTRTTGKIYCAAHSDSQINKSIQQYLNDGFTNYRIIHINNFITSY